MGEVSLYYYMFSLVKEPLSSDDNFNFDQDGNYNHPIALPSTNDDIINFGPSVEVKSMDSSQDEMNLNLNS